MGQAPKESKNSDKVVPQEEGTTAMRNAASASTEPTLVKAVHTLQSPGKMSTKETPQFAVKEDQSRSKS